MPDSAAKVANPRRADLEKLRNDLEKELSGAKSTLKRATSDLEGEKVWVGKNARKWRTELTARRRRVVDETSKLLPLVETALANEPEKVPPGEARAYRDSR